MVANPWCNKFTSRHDLLRMMDHHGVTNVVVGNILHAHISGELEGNAIPGDTVEERMAFLNAEMTAFYNVASAPEKLPHLSMSNLKEQPEERKCLSRTKWTRGEGC